LTLLSWVIYIPLQILFVPIALVGGSVLAYRQIIVSKRLGVSQTAIEIINGRWAMHVFDLRDDEPTVKLAATLPNNYIFGLWLCLLPLWVKYKISGKQALYPRVAAAGAETVVDLVIARTLQFDRIIDRVSSQVEQFVILGAGYDTRAYGKLKQVSITCFELDQTEVQQHKLESLQSAGISSEHVIFVSVDFTSESMFEKLILAGFDPAKKTLFLWEGVSLYLSEAQVRRTMQDVRQHAAVGSVLLADIYGEIFIKFANKGMQKKALDLTDEGLDFSLDFSTDFEKTLSTFIESEDLKVGESYFLGHKSDKGPYVAVVEMIVDRKA
jgi:methyltransferase (TIGR00027 family)